MDKGKKAFRIGKGVDITICIAGNVFVLDVITQDTSKREAVVGFLGAFPDCVGASKDQVLLQDNPEKHIEALRVMLA